MSNEIGTVAHTSATLSDMKLQDFLGLAYEVLGNAKVEEILLENDQSRKALERAVLATLSINQTQTSLF
jgi:hypothetical protein